MAGLARQEAAFRSEMRHAKSMSSYTQLMNGGEPFGKVMS